MSKWYKVDLPFFSSDNINYTTEIAKYVDKELQYEGRHKRTTNLRGDNKSEWKWCFKFKDEAAAMAFKLRWF